LVDRLVIASANLQMTNHPWKGRGQVTWTVYILVVSSHISRAVEAAVVNFFTMVGYIGSQHMDEKSPLKGRGPF